MVESIDRLIDWLTTSLLIGVCVRLIDWLICYWFVCVVDWLIDWTDGNLFSFFFQEPSAVIIASKLGETSATEVTRWRALNARLLCGSRRRSRSSGPSTPLPGSTNERVEGRARVGYPLVIRRLLFFFPVHSVAPFHFVPSPISLLCAAHIYYRSAFSSSNSIVNSIFLPFIIAVGVFRFSAVIDLLVLMRCVQGIFFSGWKRVSIEKNVSVFASCHSSRWKKFIIAKIFFPI